MPFTPRFTMPLSRTRYIGAAARRAAEQERALEQLFYDIKAKMAKDEFEDALRRGWRQLSAREELYSRYARKAPPEAMAILSGLLSGSLLGYIGGREWMRSIDFQRGFAEQLREMSQAELESIYDTLNKIYGPIVKEYRSPGGIRHRTELPRFLTPILPGYTLPDVGASGRNWFAGWQEWWPY